MNPYYESKGITIYHNNYKNVIPFIGQVDVTITDPPYGEQTHKGARSNTSGNKSPIDFACINSEQYSELISKILAITKRWVISFSEWRFLSDAEKNGLPLVRFGIWIKPNPTPQFSGNMPGQGWEAIGIYHNNKIRKRWNGGGTSSVFNFSSDYLGLHPTAKPLKLLEELVKKFSDEGDVVLDPFMGSGTTLLVCKKLNRKAIGIEIEEKYCEMVAKRLGDTSKGNKKGILF